MSDTDLLRKKVLSQAPVLKSFLDNFGDISVWEYAEKYYQRKASDDPVLQERKKELLHFLGNYVEGKFGLEISEQVLRSIENNYCISTADHHGPIGHPFWFQSTILRGLVNPEDAIVNFCTSNVSLGNSSYPRGVIFHNQTERNSLPFSSARDRMKPVYGFSAYTGSDIDTYFDGKLRQLNISSETKNTLTSWRNEFLKQDIFVSQGTYAEQITLLNYHWWGNIWGTSLPPLITLDAEDIVREFLLERLDHYISFEENFWNKIAEIFHSISCCFDQEKKKGTFLFWHIDAIGKRRSLWLDGSTLRSTDKVINIILNKKSIKEGLENRSLIPSGLLVYAIFSCYFGLTCFGGFSQGTYLPAIQNGYNKLSDIFPSLPRSVAPEGSAMCENMVFMLDEKRNAITALDIQLKMKSPGKDELIELAKKQTCEASLDLMLAEIERCL